MLPLGWFEFLYVNEEPLKTVTERQQAFRKAFRKSKSIFKKLGSSHLLTDQHD